MTNDDIKIKYDEATIKLHNLLEEKPTKEKIEKFIKENPGIIIKVSAKEAKLAQEKFITLLEKNPSGRQILEEEKIWLRMIKEKRKKGKNK